MYKVLYVCEKDLIRSGRMAKAIMKECFGVHQKYMYNVLLFPLDMQKEFDVLEENKCILHYYVHCRKM